MQPERAVGGATGRADAQAIAQHPRLTRNARAIAQHPRLTRNARARQLWRELLARAGGRSGKVPITETEMLALVGGHSLRASHGSPGPLDVLESIGAVEAAEDREQPREWYVFTPDDAPKPRRHDAMDDQQPPLFSEVAPADEPPPAGSGAPRLLAMPGHGAGLPRESRPNPGVPRDSRQANGGKGGRCASDTDSEQEEQETSSCSSSARESRGSPAGTWPAVRTSLVNAGVYVTKVDAVLRSAANNGARPEDAAGMAEYFLANPDRLDLNPGALATAIENWRWGMAYGCRGLWPQNKLPEAETLREKTAAEIQEAHEHERNVLYRHLRKLGWSREQISAELVRRDFEGIACKEPGNGTPTAIGRPSSADSRPAFE